MTDARTSFEDGLIADMRAHDGKVTSWTARGSPAARHDQHRREERASAPSHPDVLARQRRLHRGRHGGRLRQTEPAWLPNVRVNPDVEIETGNTTFSAQATTIEDRTERDRLWDQHVATLPWFADYPAQTGRVIPMVRLRRVD